MAPPIGLSSTGLALRAAAAAPYVAATMTTVGWRESFLLAAPVSLLMIGIWWWYATDTPAQHPKVGPGELALILADRQKKTLRPKPAGKPPGVWRAVLAHREVWLLSLSYFAMNYVFYIFSYWFFFYLTDVRGFSMLTSGWLASLPWLAGAATATLGGLWCDRLCRRIGP